MKLLFDQNLSPRLPTLLRSLYPESAHVRNLGLRDALDAEIWEFARGRGFTIVSKDSNFQQRSLFYGHPPKFVWLRLGNCSVEQVEVLLRHYSGAILAFGGDAVTSHLMLP